MAGVSVAGRLAAVEVLGVGVVEAGGVVHPGRVGGRDRRKSHVGIAEQEHVGVMWIRRPPEAEDLITIAFVPLA